ncbi:MAG: hypothetical protein U0271_20280 [Polyangiaceae bacterium]
MKSALADQEDNPDRLADAADRLRMALEMFDDAVEMLRLRWRRELPLASDEEIEARVSAWVLERPGAEHGDLTEPEGPP